MSTYGTMQTRIADELVRDDIASQIQNAILTAITMWEGTRLWFNEKRYALSTVADQEYYDWSAMVMASDSSALGTGESLLEVDSIRIENNGNWFPLRPQTMDYFDEVQAPSAQYTGVPYDYTIFGNQLRLGPIPDAVYTLTISGLARLPTLSLDSDTTAWMTEGEALIRNQAKIILAQDVLQDEGIIPLCQRSLDVALMALTRKTTAKVNTGRIRAWS